MKTVLVTGGNGQLASCLKDVTKNVKGVNFIYKDLPSFDILNKELITAFFIENKIDYCVNCAAYTAVDKAEKETEIAFNVNVKGVQNLAEACLANNSILIHISTDFVFSGNKQKLYLETDKSDPISIYGNTKAQGEEAIALTLKKYFILRTSWLYSEHGANFMKTMIRLGNEKEELSVINDQIGTPTYAKDLARVILKVIESGSQDFGLYNYSNEGSVSWYDFAKEIFLQEEIRIDLKAIPTSAYPTPAKRPTFSVLDTTKIKKTFNLEIPFWKDSLKDSLVAFHKL